MSKRQKLDYNSDELAHHLELSTGRGVDALFPQGSPPLSTETQGEVAEREEGEQSGGKTDSPDRKEPAREIPESVPTEPTIELTKGETNVATNDRTNETTSAQRQKIRHTFDIFADQLVSLKEIQLGREKAWGRKCRIGDLAQEAFDMLITKERNNE